MYHDIALFIIGFLLGLSAKRIYRWFRKLWEGDI